MPEPITLDIERLKRLPARPDVWQLAIVRLPQWIVEKDQAPYRPRLPLCHSAEADRLGTGAMLEEGVLPERAALGAIASLALVRDVRYRPTQVQVRDAQLAGTLRPLLAETGIEVQLAERLEAIDRVVAEMARKFMGPHLSESVFSGPGVDLARVRAFADAAAGFYRAAPWNHLTDADLLQIDSPLPDPGLRFCTVLGGAGIERGIGFYGSEADFQRIQGGADARQSMARLRLWLLNFEAIHELPIPDSELWEAQALPLAAERAYPSFYCIEPPGRKKLPDAAALAFAEGLLRALAETSEDELDAGRWSKSVATAGGEQTFELAIPALLEPRPTSRGGRTGGPREAPDRRLLERTVLDFQRAMAEHEFKDIDEANAFLATMSGKVPAHTPDASPAGRAQELYYEALEAHGRGRIKLAREALQVDPDCADAWVLLAEAMPDLERQSELYRQALAAAERTLGAAALEEHVGHFWGVLETRPCMRARFGLAESLWALGRRDEALAHQQELLRLNPDDNQGVRDLLVPRLLGLGRDADAAGVLAAFAQDISAIPQYAGALLEFRRSGDSEAAQARLRAAVEYNPHVPKYLLGSSRLPERIPGRYGVGGEDEAALAAASLLRPWSETPGALEWLRGFRRRGKKAREQKRAKTRRPGR